MGWFTKKRKSVIQSVSKKLLVDEPETLGQKQELFSKLLSRLLLEAERQGFQVRMGETHRAPEQAEWNASHCRVCGEKKESRGHMGRDRAELGHRFRPIGIKRSLHCSRLAVDILLFRDGKWLTQSDDYTTLGEWWEKQHELCRWGGRFRRPDGGHFSVTHRGRA